MLANLSLILDNQGDIRYDLMSNVSLEVIDQYTTKKKDHQDIRKDFEQEISSFLKFHQDYINTFQREANKKGRIVITYLDPEDSSRIYRLRVLYCSQRNKLDPNKLLAAIVKVLKQQKNPDITIATILDRSFILGSNYARNEIEFAEKRARLSPKAAELANNRLVDRIIKNTILYVLKQDPSKAYFYIRKIDAYLEQKENLQTTEKLAVNLVEPSNLQTPDVQKSVSLLERVIDQELSQSSRLKKKKQDQPFVSISDIDLELQEYSLDREQGSICLNQVTMDSIEPNMTLNSKKSKEIAGSRIKSSEEFLDSPLLDQIMREYIERGERISMSEVYAEYLNRLENAELHSGRKK